MKAYKGFNEKLQCTPSGKIYQYKIGETYEEPNANLCSNGFHACESPMDVFSYYSPSDSRFCEVELEDVSDKRDDDSKICGKKIHIGDEIGIKGIIEAGVKFVFDKVDLESKEASTGNYSASTSTGYCSVSTSTGDRSVSTSTGNYSASTSTGYRSVSIVDGQNSVALAMGIQSKAKGALGCYIAVAEWEQKDDGGWELLDIQMRKVDGETIEANMFYFLKNGEFVSEDNQ